ncbi:MAG: hypothetical protein OHK0029_24570 [Armatimonadaceae bacterium]
MAKAIEIPSEEKAQLLLQTVEDRKAESPLLLDLRGKTVLADYFLICTGLSNVHIRAIAEHVLDVAKDNRLGKPRVEGEQVGEWILMDFSDVILHIMDEETRERYKLEEFWSTPQPKGALPPTPASLNVPTNAVGEPLLDEDMTDEEDEDLDDLDLEDFDEEDWDDAAFFEDADQEVEPIEEGNSSMDEENVPIEAFENIPERRNTNNDTNGSTNGTTNSTL